MGWGGAMCAIASTAAEDFCCHMPSPRTKHRLLPFSEPFGSTSHHTRPVCVCACAFPCVSIPHTLKINHRKAGQRDVCADVKGPLKRTDGCSKPATSRSALCASLHYGLVPNVRISQAGDDGNFAIYIVFRAAVRSFTPLTILSRCWWLYSR